MDKEYLQSLYTPEQQLLLFGDANYFNNQDTNNLPFTSMADMAARNANVDLFPSPQDLYTGAIANNPTYLMKQQFGFPTGITASSVARDMSTNLGPAFGTSVDNIQGFTDKVDFSKPQEPSGIKKLLSFLPFGEKSVAKSVIGSLIGERDPAVNFMKNFYGNRFGLTDIGQVGSGIMKGYNPVSGGLINRITGGKFGQPQKIGLQDAYQKRIDRIKKTLQDKYLSKGRSLDETELDERLAELEQLKLDELNAFKAFMESKAPQSDGLGDIGTGGAGTATKTKTTTGGATEDKSPMEIRASKSPKVGVSGFTKKDDIRDSFRGRYG